MQKTFGPYELEEQLGVGGMGVVYRARHIESGRLVALKLLSPTFSSDERQIARFERELEILSKLKHPHIVQYLGGGTHEGQRYFSMELFPRGSLDLLLVERRWFSWEQTIEYGLQICSALAYAHDQGIVHRDIKPANLLLADDGQLKLTDFGLARDIEAATLTASGRTVGTLEYMAPEQIRGKPPTSAKTDLYALGCVLFEMLTGRPPFQADSPAEILYQHLEVPAPRVSSIAWDCPSWLDGLVAKLLEKDPDDRPEGARAVAARLTEIAAKMAECGDMMGRTVVMQKEGDVRSPAQELLGAGPNEILPPAVPVFLQPVFLAVSAAVLGAVLVWGMWRAVGPAGGSRAQTLWIRALSDSVPAVRNVAARALAELGAENPEAVSALTKALDDPDASTREAAARALGEIGAAAKPAVGELMSAQRSDPSTEVRRVASEALTRIRDAKEHGFGFAWLGVGSAMIALAVGGFALVRRLRAPPSVVALMGSLRADNAAVRGHAMMALERLGKAAKPAVPALVDALNDRNPSVHSGAARALVRIARDTGSVVPVLVKALKHSDPFVRSRAAVVLGQIGPAAKAAVPALIEALKDPNPYTRWSVVEALGRIGPKAREAMPALRAALRDKNEGVRSSAAESIRRIKGRPAQLVAPQFPGLAVEPSNSAG